MMNNKIIAVDNEILRVKIFRKNIMYIVYTIDQ